MKDPFDPRLSPEATEKALQHGIKKYGENPFQGKTKPWVIKPVKLLDQSLTVPGPKLVFLPISPVPDELIPEAWSHELAHVELKDPPSRAENEPYIEIRASILAYLRTGLNESLHWYLIEYRDYLSYSKTELKRIAKISINSLIEKRKITPELGGKAMKEVNRILGDAEE